MTMKEINELSASIDRMSAPKYNLIHQVRFKTIEEKETHQNMLANLKHKTGESYTELIKMAVEMAYNEVMGGRDE